jgi:beta-1,4-mannosyl-glycoprotein beta-1,4-N-acetylglucosaminyltransferase|tara:strand:- start:19 stop:795 length:777 start_codon:yes stop_codon:yes gene_type:complete
MQVFDCFIFNNEVDLLELRLNILDDVVDKFVIVEGNSTFSGNKKESNFLKNKERFEKWSDKIIYEFADIPNLERSWDREIFSRNYALTLPIFNDDDIIISSDLDEIPNPEAIEMVSEWITDKTHYTLQMNFYMYYLNNYMTDRWYGSRVATYKYLKNKTLDELRETTEDQSKITGPIIEGGGWHFSYCGGEDMIKQKIGSFSHTEHNNEQTLSSVSDNVKNNVDLFGRNVYFTVVDLDESEYPKYIIENTKKLSHLIK